MPEILTMQCRACREQVPEDLGRYEEFQMCRRDPRDPDANFVEVFLCPDCTEDDWHQRAEDEAEDYDEGAADDARHGEYQGGATGKAALV